MDRVKALLAGIFAGLAAPQVLLSITGIPIYKALIINEFGAM